MRKSPNSFSLIDVLVGTSLVFIVFSAIFGVYQLGLKVISQSKNRITATALANQKIEQAKNLSYNDLGTVGGIPAGVILESETILRNSVDYAVKTTIVYMDDPFDGLAPTDTLPTDYKRMKVKVSWSGRFSGKVELTTDIAPKGIETSVGGGTLLISVFDAQGQGLSQADLHLVNTEVNPQIDAWYQTDDSGNLVLPGAPVAVEAYQITASKAGYGYSIDRTYSTEEVANPAKPQASIYEGQLTQISFSIDKLSAFAIDTISPVGVASFSDSFLDETKISDKFHLAISNGKAELEPSHYSNIILPVTGRMKVEFVSEDASQVNSLGLFLPQEIGIFPYADSQHLNQGDFVDLGLFEGGTEVGFFLASDPNYQGPRWYTDSALNSDGFDHVRITQPGPSSWQLEWEDSSGGGDQDFNDLVVLMSLVAEGYFSSGYLTSLTISPQSLTSWDKFYFTDEEPSGTQINYQILYWDAVNWVLIPDSDLPGNSAGFNLSPVDLSELAIATYSQIRLKGNFFTTDLITTPFLYDWQVIWKTSTPVPVPYTPFKLEGAKTVGTDSQGQSVLKYSQDKTTNSSGHLDVVNLEWDSYSFSVDKSQTGLNLIEIQPPQPVDLLPDATGEVSLILKAENTLLITVNDSSTLLPIFAASVRVFNVSLGYDQIEPSDASGQAFFIPLENVIYNLEIGASGYQTYTGSVAISGDTALTINLTQLP